MDLEDEGLPGSETSIDEDIDGVEKGDDKPKSEPTVLDDAQVLSYLKTKGLQYDNLETLKNQGSSVQGMTRKINELNNQLKTLQKHPKFNDMLREAYSGGIPETDDLPDFLRNKSKQEIDALSRVFKHMNKPMLAEFRDEVFTELRKIRAESYLDSFGKQHPDFSKYEARMEELVNEMGIQNLTDKALDMLYELAKRENGGEKPGSEKPDPVKPGKKIKQIGISPKLGERTGIRSGKEPETDEEFKEAIDDLYDEGEGG